MISVVDLIRKCEAPTHYLGHWDALLANRIYMSTTISFINFFFLFRVKNEDFSKML